MVPGPQQPFAAAIAFSAAMWSAILSQPPAAQGTATNITIGANQPAPMILGRSYYGGNRVHMVGYGEEHDDVPNPYLGIVDVFSVGGPVQGLVGTYLDFTQVSFSANNAIGFYHDHLYQYWQDGETPEGSALTPVYPGMTDWTSSHKLSGKAAWLLNARFPASGEKFGSGFPQSGAQVDGVLVWDPREDDTYAGGEGDQRWASPTDTAAFTAAKATWEWSRDPGLHALRYALGTWEGGESGGDATYSLIYGIGLPQEEIWVEDFVELANICEANGWLVNGVIFEPADKWENLKNICAAGGAEPCWRNGKLGLNLSAPGVALDTITRDDLAEGEFAVPGMLGWRDRVNAIIPEYRSSAHKWEYVASDPVRVTDWLTTDGEEKIETVRFNLVEGGGEAANQAAQLGAYTLFNRREQGPFELPIGPRLRIYGPGDRLSIAEDLAADCALALTDVKVLRRHWDPVEMRGKLTLVTDNPDKHTQALAQTGTAPPGITITPPEDLDGTASGPVPRVSDLAVEPDTGKADITWRNSELSGWSYMHVLRSTTSSVDDATSIAGDQVGALGALMAYEDTPLGADDYWWWVQVYDASDNLLSTTGPVTATVT